MRIFLHFKKQQLELFNSRLIAENEKFIRKEFSLEKSMMQLLIDVQDYFKQVGESSNEENISRLKIYLDMASGGIDPVKMERTKTNRRDMLRIACFYVLSQLGEHLDQALRILIDSIEKAKETLNQVILSAYQSKLITDTHIKKTDSLDKCAKLWEQFQQNEQIKLIDKKLKLEVLQQDINILLDQTLTKLKTN
ncbi:hypothetical protein ACFSYG_08595 [Leeuwenhoekiella polynyae]|uniref:Uncharacterized protein n=1 Tax=Leeuwenhoekiella polynyae TaxID=1550906 RepID=A0A4Q0NPE7_9FLAO|nr:hypothetical protein [Leeuwenhoekiella polynyae]RXG12121.1 hypothetical protein DSM02_3967 [Leeuwenhoekiella polynyae]|tara:strand:- start:54 stop:635 length:582 start_codon:yes stop_codon:yes gene_type:complete